MQKIKCPACLGTKEYPYTGHTCIRCDGKGYVEFGKQQIEMMGLLLNVNRKVCGETDGSKRSGIEVN